MSKVVRYFDSLVTQNPVKMCTFAILDNFNRRGQFNILKFPEFIGKLYIFSFLRDMFDLYAECTNSTNVIFEEKNSLTIHTKIKFEFIPLISKLSNIFDNYSNELHSVSSNRLHYSFLNNDGFISLYFEII